MGRKSQDEVPVRPPLTRESEEDQLIRLALDLTKQRLRDGSASTQEIVHFLKLGTRKAELERENLVHQNELLRAKTESLKSQKHSEELYAEAMKAFGRYSGYTGPEEVDPDNPYGLDPFGF